jgi:hypothetical protein
MAELTAHVPESSNLTITKVENVRQEPNQDAENPREVARLLNQHRSAESDKSGQRGHLIGRDRRPSQQI